MLTTFIITILILCIRKIFKSSTPYRGNEDETEKDETEKDLKIEDQPWLSEM